MDVMKSRYHVSYLLLAITFLAVLVCIPADALAQIAKITSVKGDVIVNQSGQMTKITSPGLALNDGDQILTREGELQIAFKDGAILKINPYSKVSVQERMEQSGTWIFKSTQAARRVTCFVGKAWFKSGSSATKNYLQTPTAVAGLRGSDGDFGFNPERDQTLLNMYSGGADTVGNVLRGFFANPGVTAAQKSEVYRSLERAYSVTVTTAQANRAPNVTAEQRTINTAQANIVALAVARQAAQILVQSNPDAGAKTQAQATLSVVNTSINAVQVRVEGARAEIVRQAAVQEVQKARAAGNTQQAAAAQRVVETATAAVSQAQAAERLIAQQVTQVNQALAAGNTAGVRLIEQQVQRETQQVQRQTQTVLQQAQQVVTTVATTLPATVATTVATTVQTTAATTIPPPSSTTSSTTSVFTTTTTTTTVEPTSTTTSTTSGHTTSISPS